MAVLWRAGRPLPVREVAAELNAGRDAALAYTTVMTVMSRLAGKGILARSRSGRRFVYAPAAADGAAVMRTRLGQPATVSCWVLLLVAVAAHAALAVLAAAEFATLGWPL